MQTPLTDATAGSRLRRGGLAVSVVLGLLRGYKILISPLFTGSCRFQPSCSDYMAEAVDLHGCAEASGWDSAVSRAAGLSAATGTIPSPNVDPLHGTQGFRRHLLVVCRALRLPGALRAAASSRRSTSSSKKSNAHPGARRRRPAAPTPPQAACSARARSADRRDSRARDRRRDGDVAGRAHESWRPGPALAVEGLSRQSWRVGRSGAVRGSSGSADAVSRCIVDDAALTPRLNTALYRVTGDADGRVDASKQRGDSRLRVSGRRRAARSQGVPVRSAELRRGVLGQRDERRSRRSTRRSPGARAWATRAPRQAAAVSSPETTCSHRRRSITVTATSSASRRASVAEQPVHEGHVPIRRHRRSLLPRGRGESRQRARGVQAAHAAGSGQDTASVPGAVDPTSRSRRRTCASSSARSSSTCCGRWTRNWCARSTSACSRGSPCRC